MTTWKNIKLFVNVREVIDGSKTPWKTSSKLEHRKYLFLTLTLHHNVTAKDTWENLKIESQRDINSRLYFQNAFFIW